MCPLRFGRSTCGRAWQSTCAQALTQRWLAARAPSIAWHVPETRYLTTDDVLAIADAFFSALDYAPPVLRGGGRELLDSAMARAQMHAFYADAGLDLQAATLCAGVAQNQPFVDGNKRAAFAACVVFLRVNGHPLHEDAHDELAERVIALGTVADRATAERDLALWLVDHTD